MESKPQKGKRLTINMMIKSWFTLSSTNESLMTRYSHSGDQALLVKLYDACGDDLYHFLLTLSDSSLAKDICQKTWLKVMEKRHMYQDSGLFKAWLFTLARNLLMDEYRAVQRLSLIDNVHELSGEALDMSGSILGVFDKALMSLPFVQREAFCLQQEGFSLKEIAQITHCDHETIKSRLRYAKATLQVLLKDIAGDVYV
jgi:RNA polymerase sigma-70 factor (ECF subfamily)